MRAWVCVYMQAFFVNVCLRRVGAGSRPRTHPLTLISLLAPRHGVLPSASVATLASTASVWEVRVGQSVCVTLTLAEPDAALHTRFARENTCRMY